MIIYLSGPISLGGTSTEGEIEARKMLFAHVASNLREAGHKVINPCDAPYEATWEAYMRHGMRAVADCDRVVALPGWEESRGARLEVFVARELRIPVTNWPDDL